MEVLKGLLNSKKFWLALFGAVIWPLLIAFVPALEPLKEQAAEIAGVIVAAILGFGLADFGKAAKK